MGRKTGYLYVFFWIIWKLRIILSIVPDPCQDIEPRTQVTDMCQTGIAIEQIGESKYGNENFDHVTLRARTQEDNCTCLVFIENQSSNSFQMYIKPYEKLPSSAPEEHECGLELYLDFYHIEKLQHNQIQDPIKCKSGQASRALSFYKNSVLRFTSKVIKGNLTMGYCIDIHRVHINGENGTLKIICDVPDRIPSMNLTTTQSQDHPASHPPPTSSASTIKDESTVYIVVGGIAGGVLIIVMVVLVIILYRRKLSDKTIKKPETSKPNTTPSNEHDDPDYNGLKYNMLYVSADHQDALEEDYHTMENDQPPINKKVSEHDRNYCTVDDVARTSLNTVPTHRVVKNTHKGLGYGNSEAKEITKGEHNISQEGNGDTYAVVDKKRITGSNNKKKAALSPVYAVVDKTGKLKMENKQS